MPQKITNEAGEEVEVFTKAELDAQIEDIKKANPDRSEEINKLQIDLKKATEDLEKAGAKDQNFSLLRQQKEDAEKALNDFKKEVDGKIENVKKEVLSDVNKTHYNETIETLSGGDAELKKKIELEYNRLNDPANSKEEINKKLTDALVLATKPEDTGVLNSGIISSGNAGRPKINSGQKFTADEKKMAQQLADAGGLGKLEDKHFE